MPERQAFIDQIKGAERESYVIAAAVTYFTLVVQAGEVQLPVNTSTRDLLAATDRVEATYLIRMWAAFEMALRSFRLAKKTPDQIRAKDLVDWTAGVKQGRSISEEVRDLVLEVRKYRNYLMHGDPAPAVSIEEARKRLNTLLQCLPIQW